MKPCEVCHGYGVVGVRETGERRTCPWCYGTGSASAYWQRTLLIGALALLAGFLLAWSGSLR